MKSLETSIPRRVLALAPVLCIMALLLSSPVAHAGEYACRPDYDWAVEIDGTFPGEAGFYKTDVRGKFLIQVARDEDAYLMDMAARKLFAIGPDTIRRVESGLRIPDILPTDAPSYAFSVDGPIVRFQANGKRVRILPALRRPPIIGPVAMKDLLADRPEYREVMKTYKPDTASIDLLNKSAKEVEIEVYFGTWCGHCKRYMPKFLSVVSAVDNPKLTVKLVGVPQNFGREPGPWQGKRIQTIPAVIVKFDGREITRLGTQEGASPELELAALVQTLP